MIAASVVDEIRRLLGEGGLSQRRIAALMRVSRGTVGAIACGKRANPVRRGPAREGEDLAVLGLVARCPTCGGLVRMPCLACRVRARRQRKPTALWEPL